MLYNFTSLSTFLLIECEDILGVDEKIVALFTTRAPWSGWTTTWSWWFRHFCLYHVFSFQFLMLLGVF